MVLEDVRYKIKKITLIFNHKIVMKYINKKTKNIIMNGHLNKFRRINKEGYWSKKLRKQDWSRSKKRKE